MLRHLPAPTDPNVLVGIATSDDAGVYRINDDVAIVQTVDFFTPIVDDPYDFGRVAAANSLSDIYAMGATPITALNIAAFPADTLDMGILGQIIKGAHHVAHEAGVSILGGHTVKDDEPKFGMAVTGIVHPKKIISNSGARTGDALILTKALGTGIFATALKRGLITEAQMKPVVDSMVTLNAAAAKAMIAAGAHAATDITGFGFLGHAGEMMRGSGMRLHIHAKAIPRFAGVIELIEAGAVPGGTKDNARVHAAYTQFSSLVHDHVRLLLSDAQTSGGLLIAVAADHADALSRALIAAGDLGAMVGSIESGTGIVVE